MATPVALTIAGSDSGGGAGIQADLKTFHAFGVFGTSALTAITAQNTMGVRAVHCVPASVVHEQIVAVTSDFQVAAVKSGMLATRELVMAVADALSDARLGNYILDPVMVASSGHRLLEEDAVSTLVARLLPLSTVVTPNLDEASLLTGIAVTDPSGMRAAADWLVRHGARAALIKGGHLAGDRVTDVLFASGEYRSYERPRIQSTSTHGTGCTLSAAIAAGLAHGRDLETAVSGALAYVQHAIATAPGLGHGHGPLNHLTGEHTTVAS